MQPILVTGGAGFIGSCFVRQWLKEERGLVVNLDKLTYAGHRATLADILDSLQHRLIVGDVSDRALIAQLLRDCQPHAIVHFAAESHVDRSIDGPAAFVQTNVVGTCTLLDASLDYWQSLTPERRTRFRFLHVSTDEVFGTLGPSGTFAETAPYAPRSPYSALKAASDHFVRAYHHTYGLPVLVTHASNNYGPYQYPEKLIPVTIMQALAGEPIPIYGDGQQVRDWLFVEDHCRALRLVLAEAVPGNSFNIGGGCELTNLELVTAVCELIDQLRGRFAHQPCRQLITFVADRPGHDRRYALDDSKLRQQLEWQPKTTFEEGMRQTVEWYMRNHNWIDCVTSGRSPARLGIRRSA